MDIYPKLKKTRSGPKIPAVGHLEGRDFLAWTHFVELNISRDNSFGFELLDAFLLIKTRWQKMKKPSRFFQANFFEAILASKWPLRPNVTSPSYPSWPLCVACQISDALGLQSDVLTFEEKIKNLLLEIAMCRPATAGKNANL